MIKRKTLSVIALLACSCVTACVTQNHSDDFSNKKNHLYQKILIDANRDERPIVLNQGQRSLEHKPLPTRIGLDEALTILSTGQLRTVDYPISNAYDKGNPESPFHDNREVTSFYHPPTYEGIDNWVLEKGADVNASIEYWLAMDAIDRIHTRSLSHDALKTRIGGVNLTTNAYGRKVKSNGMTYSDNAADLGLLLNDLMDYGVDKKTAMVVAHVCLHKSFLQTMRKQEAEYFKVHEDYLSKSGRYDREEVKQKRYQEYKNYYLGFAGPLTQHRGEFCDQARDMVTKDENSPFWGDKYLVKGEFIRTAGKTKNQVVTTVRFDFPKLDVGLWQHLMNKDLYKELGRVREEGLFSGLLYPERAKFVVITSNRVRTRVPVSHYGWARYFTDHSPLDDAHRAAYWMGDTMFSWYHNKESLQGERFRQRLTSEFGNVVHYNGSQKRSIAGCTMDPTLVSYQGDDAREFRKFYSCKLGNAKGYGIFSGLRTQFEHVAAHNVDPRHEFQAVFEFNGLTTDLRKIANNCDGNEFKGLCEAERPELLQEKLKLKQSISAFSLEDAVAYTQISEVGRIEGVVLVAGFKVIYDLTDIAKWYQKYNPHNGVEWVNLTERFKHGNALAYQDETYLAPNPHDGVNIALQE